MSSNTSLRPHIHYTREALLALQPSSPGKHSSTTSRHPRRIETGFQDRSATRSTPSMGLIQTKPDDLKSPSCAGFSSPVTNTCARIFDLKAWSTHSVTLHCLFFFFGFKLASHPCCFFKAFLIHCNITRTFPSPWHNSPSKCLFASTLEPLYSALFYIFCALSFSHPPLFFFFQRLIATKKPILCSHLPSFFFHSPYLVELSIMETAW